MSEKLDSAKALNVKHNADWWDYDLKSAYKTVEKLRKRIFMAARNNDMKRVSSLQKLLLRSQANRIVAVHRATQINQGKVTAGIDNKVILKPSERAEMVEALKNYKKWNPKPTRRIYISKKNGEKRPLGIATITDRCIQAMVKNALEPYWEPKFEPTSYGFRPARSAHDAQARIFLNIKSSPLGKPPKKQWVMEGDIKGCFDNISHDYLLQSIGNFPDKILIKEWLKAGYVDKRAFYDSETGTPQGAIISPLLANIALHGLEKHLGIEYYKRWDTHGNETWVNCSNRAFVRYADDFVIFCQTEKDVLKAKEKTKEWLKKRGLSLSEEKTKVTCVTEGFNFLGWNFRLHKVSNTKSGFKTIIKPSKDSIKAIQRKLKECLIKHKGSNAQALIKDANVIIRGWTEYHKGAVSKKIFAKIDNWMYRKVVKWLRHRAPKTKRKVLLRRYFGKFNPNSNNNWVFGIKETGGYLLKLSWTNIERHALVKANYSPDNPDLKEYWDKRKSKISKSTEKRLSNKLALNILTKQKFLCPVCGQSLVFTDEERHRHHIIPKNKNGGDDSRNLRILHLSCHRKIHAIGEQSPEAIRLLRLSEKDYTKLKEINRKWWDS